MDNIEKYQKRARYFKQQIDEVKYKCQVKGCGGELKQKSHILLGEFIGCNRCDYKRQGWSNFESVIENYANGKAHKSLNLRLEQRYKALNGEMPV